jgi:hypothetical protein
MQLPSDINFFENSKLFVSTKVQPIDNEVISNLELGYISYFLLTKVKIKRLDETLGVMKTKTQILIIQPDHLTISAMNFLNIPSNFEILEIGEFIINEYILHGVSQNLVVMCKPANLTEKDMNLSQTYTFFTTQNLDSKFQFSVYPSLQKFFELKNS